MRPYVYVCVCVCWGGGEGGLSYTLRPSKSRADKDVNQPGCHLVQELTQVHIKQAELKTR